MSSSGRAHVYRLCSKPSKAKSAPTASIDRSLGMHGYFHHGFVAPPLRVPWAVLFANPNTRESWIHDHGHSILATIPSLRRPYISPNSYRVRGSYITSTAMLSLFNRTLFFGKEGQRIQFIWEKSYKRCGGTSYHYFIRGDTCNSLFICFHEPSRSFLQPDN